MSFPVALQSAIFYFVACTPCTKIRHRQKASKQAKKERQEKDKLVTEQPDLYRHPSPFNTNPYWEEEIAKGPSLPKKAASKNSSQRGLTSAGRDSSNAPSVSERTNAEESRTNIGSSSIIGEDGKISDDWNRRHGYQREDEELWGQWSNSGHKLMDAISKARDSAGRLIESTLGLEKEVTEQERRDFYFSPRNPPVNDYHPPVVSNKAFHKDAHKWMLQPPPPAKVMEGKVPVNRTISTTSRSSGTTLNHEDIRLSRVVSERFVKERLKRETSPTEDELIESLFTTRSNRSMSFPRSRSLSLDGSDESPDGPFEWRRRSRLRARAAPPGWDSDEEKEEKRHSPSLEMSRLGVPSHVAQRPKLETIRSTGSGSSSRVSSKRSRRQRSTRKSHLSGATSPVGDDSD